MAILVDSVYQTTLIESKSKFISIIFPLNNKEEFKDILLNLRKEYKDASHFCYALKYKGYAKCDDDGEPKGTAGHPILKVLETKDLDCCILVVIRYFGGKKLGAGKLLRTYVKSAADVVNIALKRA